MAKEDLLAIAIAVLGIASGFLAFLVTLFPPPENARRKKRAWLILFAVLAVACVVLIPWQQVLSINTRKKSERISVEFREVHEAAAQLAEAVQHDPSDLSGAIREAIAKLAQTADLEDRLKECAANGNRYTDSLIDRSQLRDKTSSDPSDPPARVLDKAAAMISDLDSAARECGAHIVDLTQKYQQFIETPRQCPQSSSQCPPPAPTFCSNRWAILSSSKYLAPCQGNSVIGAIALGIKLL